MKGWTIAAILLASGAARADVFAFKDADGFEKCMQLDHLIEHVKTGDGAQTRILGPAEIQPRCVEAAAKLVAQTKDKQLASDCIAITRREAGPDLALDLVGALVDLSLPSCNPIEIYEILMHPLDSPPGRALAKAKPIIKRCLKDGDFKKDFLEEKDSGDATRAANACQILLEEKLVKACKK